MPQSYLAGVGAVLPKHSENYQLLLYAAALSVVECVSGYFCESIIACSVHTCYSSLLAGHCTLHDVVVPYVHSQKTIRVYYMRIIPRESKKLQRFIFARTLSNQALF